MAIKSLLGNLKQVRKRIQLSISNKRNNSKLNHTFQPINKSIYLEVPSKHHIPELKPLQLNQINTQDLNIGHHKLNQYSNVLDKLNKTTIATTTLTAQIRSSLKRIIPRSTPQIRSSLKSIIPRRCPSVRQRSKSQCPMT